VEDEVFEYGNASIESSRCPNPNHKENAVTMSNWWCIELGRLGSM